MSDAQALDRLDRGILRCLQANGRETYDVIGDQVGLSPSAVLRRVKRLEETGVNVHLNRRVAAEDLADHDHVLLATGVRPRVPDIEGVDHPSVCTYADVLSGRVEPAGTVAVLGAVTSGGMYWISLRLMREIPASAATSSAFLIPMFGVTWGGLFLGEPVTAGMVPGVVLVLAACALVTGFNPFSLFGPRRGR